MNKVSSKFVNLIRLISQEAKLYIENVEEKFGSYRLVDKKTPFDPTIDYLSSIIPGAISPETLASATDDQLQSNADSATTQHGNTLSDIDLTESNEFGKDDHYDDHDTLNDHHSTQNKEPQNKRVRFSNAIEHNKDTNASVANDNTLWRATESASPLLII